jgi:hypothetical protein
MIARQTTFEKVSRVNLVKIVRIQTTKEIRSIRKTKSLLDESERKTRRFKLESTSYKYL